jgi:hypothetical protein
VREFLYPPTSIRSTLNLFSFEGIPYLTAVIKTAAMSHRDHLWRVLSGEKTDSELRSGDCDGDLAGERAFNVIGPDGSHHVEISLTDHYRLV